MGLALQTAARRDLVGRQGVLLPGAPELDQLFASRARISVPFGIKSEVGARKRPVRPGGLVEDGNVRCDLLLFDEPSQALGRTVGAVGGQIIRLQAEATLR